MSNDSSVVGVKVDGPDGTLANLRKPKDETNNGAHLFNLATALHRHDRAELLVANRSGPLVPPTRVAANGGAVGGAPRPAREPPALALAPVRAPAAAAPAAPAPAPASAPACQLSDATVAALSKYQLGLRHDLWTTRTRDAYVCGRAKTDDARKPLCTMLGGFPHAAVIEPAAAATDAAAPAADGRRRRRRPRPRASRRTWWCRTTRSSWRCT